MKDFVLIYQHGDPTWTERRPEEIDALMKQWAQWFKELEASGNLRDPGAPLAPGGITLRKNGNAIVTETDRNPAQNGVGWLR